MSIRVHNLSNAVQDVFLPLALVARATLEPALTLTDADKVFYVAFVQFKIILVQNLDLSIGLTFNEFSFESNSVRVDKFTVALGLIFVPITRVD